MKIGNVTTAPNGFLKAYRSRTFAVAAGDYFAFGNRVNNVYDAHDNTFDPSGAWQFYGNNEVAELNSVDPSASGALVLRAVTKKAVIKFHKHPSAASTEFLANYSFAGDMFLPTFIGATPDPFNAMAKDGDELEIYGLTEISKFFCGPLNGAFPSVPYLLTVILFE